MQPRERVAVDEREKRAAVDRGVREHRLPAQHVPRVDVPRIGRHHRLEVREPLAQAAGEEHAGDRRPGARCRDAPDRPEAERRRRFAPEAGLPEAAVPAACERGGREARLTDSGQRGAPFVTLVGPA
jgi:hypothetical protein